MSEALQVFYEGRVQGVGFRYAVRRMAAGFDVSGYVRNLPDGRVELVARGEADEFVQAVRESELSGFIAHEVVQRISLAEKLRGFEIRV